MQLFITLQARNDFFARNPKKGSPLPPPSSSWMEWIVRLGERQMIGLYRRRLLSRFDPINHDFSGLSRKKERHKGTKGGRHTGFLVGDRKDTFRPGTEGRHRGTKAQRRLVKELKTDN